MTKKSTFKNCILMKMVFKLKANLLQTLKVTNTLTMQKLVTWKMKMSLL